MKNNTVVELKKLARNIKIARKRRNLSLTELSNRSGVSRPSLTRIEKADETVGIGKYLNVLSVLGLLDGIAMIADPSSDFSQARKEIENIRRDVSEHKVNAPAITDEELNF